MIVVISILLYPNSLPGYITSASKLKNDIENCLFFIQSNLYAVDSY